MTTGAPVLLMTRDDLLRDDLMRLAAAAGASVDVSRSALEGLRGWTTASIVLVGADLAAQLAEQRPPRRDQVHVVGHGPIADSVFRDALAAGALDVVELPAAETWLVELLTDAADASPGGTGRRAHTVGVLAGSGGAGATTFACAVALVSSRQELTALLDLDPLGPGLDRVVGLDEAAGVRWDSLVASHGRLGSRSLREALPDRDGLAVLTWGAGPPVDLDAASVREVLSASQRGNDVVVVDLPRAVDDLVAEVVTRCDQVLVVTEQSVAGVASAGKLTALLRPLNDRLGLVARGTRAAVPAAQVSSALGLPLVCEVPHQRRLAEHVDLGLGPVHATRSSLTRAARVALALRENGRSVA